MKRRIFLEKLAVKAGLTDQEFADFMKDPDADFADEQANKALELVMTADEAVGNDVVFGRAKGKAKAEALDPIDGMLKKYEPKLSATQKTAYTKLGTDSYKKYQFILDAFSEADTKTGDKNFDDLQADFNALKKKIDDGDYVDKSEIATHQTAAQAARQDAAHVSLLNRAIRSGKLRDVSTDRHFERNFVADAQDLLSNKGIGDKKVKGVIDYSTGKIMRADSPDQPLMIGSNAATLADLAELTITSYDWAKKSDSVNADTTITNDSTSTQGMSPAQKRMREQDNADKA
ncbi:hypothetical protein [Tellurirhabdus bombi]|uniref:hypothetical protein n=1 Tax=Tellurirhabdus bombi TaxID=2907205 RepID=UPI001F381AC8|nr:hypothetical protein [Tellurirhabdus bombi]